MKIQLSGGVVASSRRAWVAGRSGPVEVVDEPVLPLGAPVALGPDGARADQVEHHDDELILGLLRNWIADPEERLADVARWTPPDYYWRRRLDGIIQDAFAAIALLRTAAAVGEYGLNDGLERSADLLRVAESLLPALAAAAAARKVTGLTGLPTRPGAYVRDIHRRLASADPQDHRFEGFVRPRLACGRDFALVIMREVDDLLDNPRVPGSEVLKPWAASDMRSRRKDFGYSHARPPAEWHGIPHWTDEMLGVQDSLAGRLAAGG